MRSHFSPTNPRYAGDFPLRLEPQELYKPSLSIITCDDMDTGLPLPPAPVMALPILSVASRGELSASDPPLQQMLTVEACGAGGAACKSPCRAYWSACSLMFRE
jgi:hypothetical protein